MGLVKCKAGGVFVPQGAGGVVKLTLLAETEEQAEALFRLRHKDVVVGEADPAGVPEDEVEPQTEAEFLALIEHHSRRIQHLTSGWLKKVLGKAPSTEPPLPFTEPVPMGEPQYTSLECDESPLPCRRCGCDPCACEEDLDSETIG